MHSVRKRSDNRRGVRRRISLGPLEACVMAVLWDLPSCTVHEVQLRLPGKRAYTTVMTTMVRLFQKGLLCRRKKGHGFVYFPQVSAEDWGRLAASEFVANFVAVPHASTDLLISSLAMALNQLDPRLLPRMRARVPDKPAREGIKRN